MSYDLPRMAFFGRRYDAPVYEGTDQIPTPVGKECVWCKLPFTSNSDGFRYVSGEHTHLYCNLRNLLGDNMAGQAYEQLLLGPRS